MTALLLAIQVAALKTFAIQVAELKTALAVVQLLQLVVLLAASKCLLATTAAIQVAKSSVLACWICSSNARAKVAMKFAAMQSVLADVVRLQPHQLLLLHRKLLQCHQLQPLTTVHSCKASAASFRLALTFDNSNRAS